MKSSHGRLTTASLIARYLADNGPTVISQQALADVIGRSRRSVQTAVAELERAGVLSRRSSRRDDGYKAADELSILGASRLAQFLEGKGIAIERTPWPSEVTALRNAMVDAGIRCSWRTLRADVLDEIVGWVRQLGIARLVAEARARIWSPCIRHVAAFLRFWRDLRPPRPLVCPFHPHVEQPRGTRCAECVHEHAMSVPMPKHLRDAIRLRYRRVETDTLPTRKDTHAAPL